MFEFPENMSKSGLSVKQTLAALRLSIIDGGFAHIYANLTGSVFLPGYSLALNANSLEIGVLAAIPFFATTAQFFGSYLVERKQNRKRLVIGFVAVGRAMWIPVVLCSVWLGGAQTSLFLKLLIVLIFASHVMGSISGVAWLSWMAGLVPDEIRGRFFGLRNSILGIVGILITLAGGYFLDWFTRSFPFLPKIRAFEILFILAILAGAFSLWFLQLKPELPNPPRLSGRLRQVYRAPLRETGFRRLLIFAVLRSFGTNIAAPFFVVYLLEDLRVSYATVGIFTMLTAVADLTGMWIWGHLSDHLGNRPIIIFTAIFSTIFPAFWIFASGSAFSMFFLIPFLHLSGGFVWAGYNLCTANLVYRSAPAEGNSVYFAYWSVGNGVASGLGALAGGMLAQYLKGSMGYFPAMFDSVYKLIFLISVLVRAFPLFMMRRLQEPQSLRVRHTIRVLLNVKAWPSLMGFQPVLHFFLPGSKRAESSSLYWPIWRSPAAGSEEPMDETKNVK